VGFWDGKYSLSRTYDWFLESKIALGEDPDDLRFSHTQINYKFARVIWIM
jgi:hypothetical protein